MKEYWVNVYEYGTGSFYTSKLYCIDWNKTAYLEKRVKYRLHIKMKDCNFDELKLINDWIESL